MKTRTLKIRRVGNSLGAVFPKELLDELHVAEGDEVRVVRRGADLVLTAAAPELDAALAAFEVGRRQYRNTLRRLAE